MHAVTALVSVFLSTSDELLSELVVVISSVARGGARGAIAPPFFQAIVV